METLINSTPFVLTLVVGSYLLGLTLYRRTKIAIMHPLVTSIVIIIGVLESLHVEYASFQKGSYLVDFMMAPSVVALGYTLYEQTKFLRGKLVSILTSVTVGAFVGLASVILCCRWLGSDAAVIASIEPKSVTSPIALSLSERSGGIASLTAIAVVISGVFGSIVSPFLLRITRVNSPTAKGLAMGSASHGLGTARAIELGAIEGAFGGLAIGVMGIATSLLMPLVEGWLL